MALIPPADPLCADALIVQRGRNSTFLYLTDAQRAFTRDYFWTGIALNIICFAVWILEKGKYERTQIRPTIFVVLAVLCSIAEMGCGPLQAFTLDAYPCWVGVVLLALAVPFCAASITGRYMLFSFLSRFAQGASAMQAKWEQDTTQSIRSVGGKSYKMVTLGQRIKNVAKMLLLPYQQPSSEEELFDLKFLSSNSGMFIVTAILTSPVLLFVIINLATDPVVTNCYNCAYDSSTRSMIIGISVTYLIIGITFWYAARKNSADDQWGLKSECFRCLIWAAIAIAGFMVSILDNSQPKLSPYTHNFMMTFGLWLFVIEQTIFQVLFARFQQRKVNQMMGNRKQVTNVSQADPDKEDDLTEILSDKTLADLFEQHLVGELGAESLYFLRQCEDWRRVYFDVSPTTRLTRAKKIFKSYINVSGLYAVNVPSEVCERIKVKVMAQNAEDVPREVFDDAIREVKKLLTAGAIPRFKASARYAQATKHGATSLAISTGNA